MDQERPEEVEASSEPPVARPRRRTPPARMAVWLVILAAILCYMGYVRFRAEQQERKIENLVAHYGLITYNYQGARAGAPEGPEILRAMLGDQYLVEPVSVWFNNGITDQQLGEVIDTLASLPTLTYVDIDDAKVTDEGLQQLARVKQLRKISIAGTKISDRAVRELQKHFKPQLSVNRTPKIR